MADLRAELTDAQELNQKLYADIEMMSKDLENEQHMEEMVVRVQQELGQVRVKSDMKDLKL